jgi:hypothetical protein
MKYLLMYCEYAGDILLTKTETAPAMKNAL